MGHMWKNVSLQQPQIRLIILIEMITRSIKVRKEQAPK